MFILIMKGKNSNILNGGFLSYHSEPLGEAFHVPLKCKLCDICLGLPAQVNCKTSNSAKQMLSMKTCDPWIS